MAKVKAVMSLHTSVAAYCRLPTVRVGKRTGRASIIDWQL